MIFSSLNELGSVVEHGGKGHNLKLMVNKGFNVPDGAVLNASFYRRQFPPPPEFNFDDEAVLAKQCAETRRRILKKKWDEESQKELAIFLSKYNDKQRFAVRSSSTFEDLAGAAFAGQHDTFLNVPLQEIESKIKACLSSLWQPHAVQYRKHHGFSQEDATMAVVIQEMIPGEVSGVAFAVDPVSGKLNHILIEANYGLGESIVGGESVTDSWIVDSETWSIVERRIAEKSIAVYASENGVEERRLEGECLARACLNDEQILSVAKEVRKLMELFSIPQDCEWTFWGDHLYLLQTRPQTTIPPRFTRDESAERFPEPLTPLTWSCMQEAFNNSLEYSLKLMNIHLPTRPWFDLKNNYIYGNQNAVELLALRRPIQATNLTELIDEIPVLYQKYQWVRDLPQKWMRDLDRYLIRIGNLSHQTFDHFTCDDFQKYFKEFFNVANNYFLPNIAISMTQAFLTGTLLGIIKMLKNDELEANNILKKVIAAPGTKTGQVNQELYEMAGIVRGSKELRDLFRQGTQRVIEQLDQFPEFSSRFQKFLSDYGHREVHFDYYFPTWAEAPEIVLDLIFLNSTVQTTEDPVSQELRIRNEQVAATQDLYACLPKEAHFFLHELIRLTLDFTFLDDLEHFQTTRINLMVRRILGAFGRAVIKVSPELRDPYNLFFLTRQELESLKSFSLPGEMLKIIGQRKKEFDEAKMKDPPWYLDDTAEETHDDKDMLKGTPGSLGTCEGPVYLVRGVEDFAGMPEGAILVAKTTSPAWTPLFYKAKGIITASGGPLSHGAITARELGLPAVMCVRNCLSILHPGEMVTIEGQKGVVKRHGII